MEEHKTWHTGNSTIRYCLFLLAHIGMCVRKHCPSVFFLFLIKKNCSRENVNMMNCLKDLISNFLLSLDMVKINICREVLFVWNRLYPLFAYRKKNAAFIFFFLFARYYCHFNRIHREREKKKRYLPSSCSLLLGVFLLYQLKKIFVDISTFFIARSLFDKALCKLCAFSSNVSLSLCYSDAVWKRQMASLLYAHTCVYFFSLSFIVAVI